MLHDPTCQSVKQLQKMLFSLLKRAHTSPEGLKEAIYHTYNIFMSYIYGWQIGNIFVILFQGLLVSFL